MQVEFDEHGCKAFFKKYRGQEKAITTMISTAITREVATGMTKVKLATRKKIKGQTVYEFRLNLGKLGSARLAFTVAQEQAIVYFISNHLQKSTFSREFNHAVAGIG